MATATFYNTSKRHNSTLVPSGGSDMEVVLKGGADLNAPLFLLSSGSIPNYSMMRFEGKYYFINKVRSVRNDLYELECSVDVLATYKSNIKAMSAYVLYYSHDNTEITDTRLSTKTTKSNSHSSASFSSFGSAAAADYALILSVVGNDSCAVYACSQNQVNSLIDADFSDKIHEAVDSIDEITGEGWDKFADAFRWVKDFLKTLLGLLIFGGNTTQNIKSCFILPIAVSQIAGSYESVSLGEYDTGVLCKKITGRTFHDITTVSIPWQASDWRRNAPYHEIFLYIPLVGLTSISASDVIGESSLAVEITVDILSGDAIVKVYRGSSYFEPLAQYTTNIASPYAIGSSNILGGGASQIIGGIATTGAGLVSGNALAATHGALGIVNSLQPQPTSIGSNAGGAFMGLTNKQSVSCYTVFHDTTVSPSSVSAISGTPANQVLSLSGVSGYVRTANASVSGSMTDDERQEINTLMNGGVYIE